MSTQPPRARLATLVASSASGELICCTPELEVHVYLQGGRVAWATDSQHPYAFAIHLQDTAKIDRETFREVVEECRRERLPVGETLVSWKLAPHEVVRASLSHQIAQALALLATMDSAQVLFLDRVYEAYDDRLTFELRDFASLPALAPAPERAVAPIALADQVGMARRVRETVEGLEWVELLEHERVVDSEPRSPDPRVPRELLRATLVDGADFTAARSARGSVVGLRLEPPGRSMWCRLAGDSTFGTVVSAIATMLPEAAPPEETSAVAGEIAWTTGAEESAHARELQSFLRRAREVLAALVLSSDAGVLVAGVGVVGLEEGWCRETARRRLAALTEWHRASALVEARDLGTLPESVTIVTAEPAIWCYGAELDPESGESLWLFTGRRKAQGLGWAYLSALTRILSRARSKA